MVCMTTLLACYSVPQCTHTPLLYPCAPTYAVTMATPVQAARLISPVKGRPGFLSPVKHREVELSCGSNDDGNEDDHH